MLRNHAQRVSGLLKNDEGRAEAVGKAGRDGGGKLHTRSGKWLDDNKRVRRMESERLRSSPSRADTEGLSAVGAGCASGPYPKDNSCSRNDGDRNGGGERPKVCGDACCPLHNVLEAQRVVQPDGW